MFGWQSSVHSTTGTGGSRLCAPSLSLGCRSYAALLHVVEARGPATRGGVLAARATLAYTAAFHPTTNC